jgi:cyclophilin family peptidyl-prolyl cis-trans isomerase
MRHFLLLGCVLYLLWPSHGLAAKPPCASPEEAEAASEVVVVELDTDVGTLRLGLLPGVAPDTVANFLDYVGTGAYDGIFVHRAVPGFVVQMGGYKYQDQAGTDAYTHIPTTGTVENEFCLSNMRGTVAMAKLGGDPDSATSEWFVNVVDNTALDSSNGGFTVFGRVLDQENNPIRDPGTSLGVPDEIDAGPQTDGRFSLEVYNRETFKNLPLVTELAEAPAGYGCFSTEEVGLLLTIDLQYLQPDPLTGGPVYVSRTCTDSGENSVPDTWPCTPGVGRSVLEYDLATEQQVPVIHDITCDELAQSETSFAARRADLAPQVPSRLVKVNSATVVPEPGVGLLGLASAATLALLRRRRMRNPTRPPRQVAR